MNIDRRSIISIQIFPGMEDIFDDSHAESYLSGLDFRNHNRIRIQKQI